MRLASAFTRAGVAAAAACLLLLALWPGQAAAHKVNVFAYAEGGKVYTQSYFNDGRPSVDSTIEVYDGAGKLLLKGKTDDNGEFSFPAPAAPTGLKIVLVASMGHKNEFLLPASDLPAGPVAATTKRTAPAKAAPKEPGPPPEAAGVGVPIDEMRLRALIDESLEARLAPLTKMVVRLNEREHVGAAEVFAGIGYIFGLAGVAAWVASRKRSK